MVQFPNQASEFVYVRSYSRWLEDQGRREMYEETVDRYIDFIEKHVGDRVPHKVFRKARQNLLSFSVMPSMRAFWSAGDAAEATNVAFYNCAFQAIDSIDAFAECLYILMCVTEDTWVSTSFGPRRVKDLIDRPFVAMVGGEPHFSKTGFFKTGVRRTRVIEADGFLVQLTDNHPLLVRREDSDEWVKACDVREGDDLVLADPGLSSWDGDGTEEQGYLLGYFVGDGNFGHLGKAEFASYEPEEEAGSVRKALKDAVLNLRGRSDRQGWKWDEKKKGWRLIDRQTALLANRFGMHPGNKVVTTEVESASSDFYSGFLRGVFDADGYAVSSTNERSIGLKWVDKPSLQAVQRMLARMGIRSVVREGPGRRTEIIRGKEVNCKQQWILRIFGEDRARFVEKVGFLNDKKKGLSETCINHPKAGSRTVRVTSNTVSDEREVFDVQVEGIHAFDANGIVAHNCGAGYGFSVEKKYVDKLPVIGKLNGRGSGTFQIPDSKEGWADSVKHLMTSLYSGNDLEFDYTLLRPKGARLKTFGGRSSGSAPLISLHEFIRKIFGGAQGRKLKSIECLDILNKIAEIVVVGGVRRSSQICLSDLDDQDVAKAKVWPFPLHRSMSNNSAAYHEKPGAITLMREWSILAESGSGERGIINLHGARKMSPERRDASKIVGVNPCAEILLRSCEFCNLSEVVIRAEDDLDDVLQKIETAVWLGAIQSTFTKFPYLNRKWKRNCEDERLLGVSLTGQMDNPALFTEDALKAMLAKSVKVAKKACKTLGINLSAAVTCVKPSGTVSQLVNSASGLHPRYSKFYIRRYRIASMDPLFRMLVDQGVEMSPENGQREKDWKKAQQGDLNACPIYEKGKRWSEDKVNTWVISFPVKAPEGSVTRNDLTALQQLEYYKKIQKNWCEHNASCFAGHVRFCTSEGLKRFDEFEDCEKVRVLSSSGRLATGVVRHLGHQKIWKLNLRSGNRTMSFDTTEDHLWPVTYAHQRWAGYDRKLYKTSDLPVGKQLDLVVPSFEVEEDSEAVLHGIVFGDGTTASSGKSCSISLCHDSRAMKSLFSDAGYKLTERDDINQTRIYSLPNHWKRLPDDKSSPEYIRGFLSGWFAADGHVSKDGRVVSLSCFRKDHLKWVQRQATKAGLAVSTHIKKFESGDGSYSNNPSFSLSFLTESLNRSFLSPHLKKMDRFFSKDRMQSSKRWRIESVEPTDREEPVFCLEVPADRLFVLEGNVLTHNCTVYIGEDEWIEVQHWVYKNWKYVTGLSFLPKDGGKYEQAPYQEVTEEEYEELAAEFPQIDYSQLSKYETEDHTKGSKELACTGDTCEI